MSLFTISRPIPLDPPVTIATLGLPESASSARPPDEADPDVMIVFSLRSYDTSELPLFQRIKRELNLNSISQGRYRLLRSLRVSPSSNDIWQQQRRVAACPQATGVRASAQPRRASLSSGRSCRVLLASREVQSSVSKRCSVTRASRCRESRALLLVEWSTIPVADRSPDRPLAILQARRRLQAQRGCEEGSQLLGAGCL